MRFFFRDKIKKRSHSIDDPHYWPNIFGKLFGTSSKAGVTVNSDTAMQSGAVYACIRVIAETIASLPLNIYKKNSDNSKEIAYDHPLNDILHNSPNAYQTAFEHREMKIGQMCLRGNSYDYILRNGKILGLIPLHPDKMRMLIKDGKIYYEYTNIDLQEQETKDKTDTDLLRPKGGEEKNIFRQEEIWHTKGLSTNGLMGVSPVSLAREAIGLSLATEEYGAKFFGNDARPGGILSTPGALSEDAAKRLVKQWESMHKGSGNAWKVAVLENDLKWQQIGMTNEDSQFLETRNYQIEEIARIFRVPAILIQHPDKTMTYKSSEQFMLSFVIHTIRPWLIRIEQSINKYLLSEKDRKKGYFAEHKIEGLLRGNIIDRYNAYAIGRQNKWLSANEIRALENMNPIEGGDKYENPNITIDKKDEPDEEDREENLPD
ncbi:MAG: phage portal protein [Spirochaetota bacterium]|nr:phage portal protein [Spirochaetota bacterium]